MLRACPGSARCRRRGRGVDLLGLLDEGTVAWLNRYQWVIPHLPIVWRGPCGCIDYP